MTKFVKIKEHGGDNIVINLDHVEQIQSLASENLLSVITATGTHFIIHEDDWRMLGIDLVQELHSRWKADQGKSDHLVDATLYAFAATDLCQGEPSLEQAVMEIAQHGEERGWCTPISKLGKTVRFGPPPSENHKFGTQQYVKDTSVKDES